MGDDVWLGMKEAALGDIHWRGTVVARVGGFTPAQAFRLACTFHRCLARLLPS